MATAGDRLGTRDDEYSTTGRTEVRRVERDWTETKASVRTTELIVLVLAVIGVFIAGITDDSVNTETTWTLITALAIGYMVSRGLAKAGSPFRSESNS